MWPAHSCLGIAVLIGLTLVAAALPSDMAPGNAAARDRDHRDDDDDRSRADRDRHHGFKDFSIEVLSGRPDMIAGGDALVRVSVKEKDVRLRDVAIRLNGAKVTRSFLVDHTTRTLTGLLTGLQLGSNRLEVDADADADGKGKGKGRDRPEAAMTLVNHPIRGRFLRAARAAVHL